MKSFFIALIVTAGLLLVVTGLLGTMVEGSRYFDHHFAAGLVATLFLCFMHSVVFTYFMATNKMIKLAVEDAGLDAGLFERARAYKLRAYRAVMPAIGMALAAAFTGAWATDRPDRATIHLLVVLASAAVQIAAWMAEYVAVTDNRRLMDEVFELHERARPGAQP